MALLGMPILLMNMGGEMLYILEQRLQAQAINADKSKRVLQDVVRTMFNAKFIEELMKPQELYSMSSLRGVFDRLAHSSIMRLSESSMDKLFDLMTMGVKYQLVSSTYAGELVDVTLNHLLSIRDLIAFPSFSPSSSSSSNPSSSSGSLDDKPLDSLVLSFIDQFKKRYENLSVGDFMELKQTLHAFFQDRRIKVSLFLQEGLQTSSGAMVFPELEFLPPGVMIPNTIRYYASGNVRTESIPYTGKANVRSQPVQSKLGLNLYSKSKTQPTPVPETSPAPQTTTSATTTAAPTKSTPSLLSQTPPDSIEETEAPDLKPTSKIGAAELNLLAQLINKSNDNDKDAVKVNLFGGDTWGQYEVNNVNSSATIVLDPTHEKNPYLNNLMDNLSIQTATPSESDSGQDLLDLMDSVG